jgi:hypothetical protein
MAKPVYAWHFVKSDERGLILRDGTPAPKAGETLKMDGEIIPCKRGYHASVNPLDACYFAPGSYITRVKLGGTIKRHGGNKVVASERTILYGFEASRVLRLFACWCVRNTKLADGRTPWDLLTDERSRRAVEVAEAFALGNATHAAWYAARYAAWDVASDAAWYAARAAAGAAASDAAWGAAWDAARYADWAAARDAAGDAVWDAVWDAARDTAGDAASKQLTKMLKDEAERLNVYRPDR